MAFRLDRAIWRLMLFTRCFHTECERLAPLFAAAQKADQEFHAAWKDGCDTLGFGRYKQTARYGETLDRYREATRVINEIVSTAFTQAQSGDDSHIPTLFAYIALPGRYSGSGYQRAAIWRFIKRLPPNEEHARILQGVVVHQIETAGPEFSEIVRTARKINSADLRQNVRNILSRPGKTYVLARANRLLGALESSSP
jgi:hypothetical protein